MLYICINKNKQIYNVMKATLLNLRTLIENQLNGDFKLSTIDNDGNLITIGNEVSYSYYKVLSGSDEIGKVIISNNGTFKIENLDIDVLVEEFEETFRFA